MLEKPQLLLGFADYDEPARNLANQLHVPYAEAAVHTFPDGESKLTLPQHLPERIALCRSLDRPNSKLIELLLAAQTARRNGALEITLIAPYLCYMRQDMAFNPGESISQKIIGRFLAEQFDSLLTVDAHLHRVRDLRQAVPARHAVNLSAAGLIGAHIKASVEKPFLIGPDEESGQWVRTAAQAGGFEYAVAFKKRRGDNSVQISLPDKSFARRNVVIVDDMVSTGQTIMETARLLMAQHARAVYCVTTHALFQDHAAERMRRAGIQTVWSTDSVQHPASHIPLARLLAAAFAD